VCEPYPGLSLLKGKENSQQPGVGWVKFDSLQYMFLQQTIFEMYISWYHSSKTSKLVVGGEQFFRNWINSPLFKREG
jgi:hypothetical protein